ncbi:MAG: hypothetical protein Q8800_02830, partial [Candidatus Phytoplasma australasiaticum]|nr:hypothetical protein [Candidatus Phytoplasma australasiaticum]
AKEVEVATLKSELQKVMSSGPGPYQGNEELLSKLKDENDILKATNASLCEEIKALNKQLIKSHEDANERVLLLRRTFNSTFHSS